VASASSRIGDSASDGDQTWDAHDGQAGIRLLDHVEGIVNILFQDAPKASTECLIRVEGQFSTPLSELEFFLPARRFKKRTPKKTQKKSSISLFIFAHLCVYGD
jgi:hypothetical protein